MASTLHRFCGGCGKEFDNDGAFCGHCGASRVGNTAPAASDDSHGSAQAEQHSSAPRNRVVQAEAQHFPTASSAPEKSKTSKHAAKIVLVSGIVLLLLIVITAISSGSSHGGIGVVADPRPQNEKDFLRIMSAAQAAGSSENEIRQDTGRKQRGTSLCHDVFQNGTTVTDWIGTVKDVRTSSVDGKAALNVNVAEGVTLESDSEAYILRGTNGESTLISQGSAIYNALADTQIGDKVRFSGSFERSDKPEDCITEKSITTKGSLTDPEYRFRFTSLNKVN